MKGSLSPETALRSSGTWSTRGGSVVRNSHSGGSSASRPPYAHHPRGRGWRRGTGLSYGGRPSIGLVGPKQEAALKELDAEVGARRTRDRGGSPTALERDAERPRHQDGGSRRSLRGPRLPTHRPGSHAGPGGSLRHRSLEDQRVVREGENPRALALANDPSHRSGLVPGFPRLER
jgi:hypothetical protein